MNLQYPKLTHGSGWVAVTQLCGSGLTKLDHSGIEIDWAVYLYGDGCLARVPSIQKEGFCGITINMDSMWIVPVMAPTMLEDILNALPGKWAPSIPSAIKNGRIVLQDQCYCYHVDPENKVQFFPLPRLSKHRWETWDVSCEVENRWGFVFCLDWVFIARILNGSNWSLALPMDGYC